LWIYKKRRKNRAMLLGVNLDHIATVRQARKGHEPDPVMAAPLAILGGAEGITIHLREDRRHIQDRDLKLLRQIVQMELNLEMAATSEMTSIALEIKPDMVTLVPEKRQELTTEGGLDLHNNMENLKKTVNTLQSEGIPVSLFINPDSEDIHLSAEIIKAKMIEIHTGYYSLKKGKERDAEFERIAQAIEDAQNTNLAVNAGHGLDYHNVRRIAALSSIRGLYIGHSIISRAVFVGLERAVREMKELIRTAR
jgi:pyridoxine 5-phosphate synthase